MDETAAKKDSGTFEFIRLASEKIGFGFRYAGGGVWVADFSATPYFSENPVRRLRFLAAKDSGGGLFDYIRSGEGGDEEFVSEDSPLVKALQGIVFDHFNFLTYEAAVTDEMRLADVPDPLVAEGYEVRRVGEPSKETRSIYELKIEAKCDSRPGGNQRTEPIVESVFFAYKQGSPEPYEIIEPEQQDRYRRLIDAQEGCGESASGRVKIPDATVSELYHRAKYEYLLESKSTRISKYYTENLLEGTTKIAELRETFAGDPAERDARIGGVIANYTINVGFTLLGVYKIDVPCKTQKFEIARTDGKRMEYTYIMNLAADEGYECPICGSKNAQLKFCDKTGRIGCSCCVTEKCHDPACRKEWISGERLGGAEAAFATGTDAASGEAYCAEHLAVCSDCGKTYYRGLMKRGTDKTRAYCPDCVRACASCGAVIGKSEVLSCSNPDCTATFCRRCNEVRPGTYFESDIPGGSVPTLVCRDCGFTCRETDEHISVHQAETCAYCYLKYSPHYMKGKYCSMCDEIMAEPLIRPRTAERKRIYRENKNRISPLRRLGRTMVVSTNRSSIVFRTKKNVYVLDKTTRKFVRK